VTILIRKDRNAEPFYPDPLDTPLPLPPSWNGPHVALRITEGFTTLAKMPRGDRTGMRSAWPAYMYEFNDLVDQAEQGELERTQAEQNRVRVVPSAVEIAHMEASTYWPAQYLGAKPDLREAVNLLGLAYSLGLDARWVAKKRGGLADTWRERHDRGCELIARAGA
jgi:hypothetical protein